MKRVIVGRMMSAMIVGCLGLSAEAANKPKASASAVDAVQALLESEPQAENSSVDRRYALNPASRTSTEPNPVWWQAGYIQVGKQWRPLEETVVESTNGALLDEYREHRAKLSNEPHGQWKLALWCRKNGLHDQERVHLLRVLEDRDPTVNTDIVYERLGCQLIGGVWVSPQERRDAAAMSSEYEHSHKRWDSKLAALVQPLQGTPKQVALAEKHLAEITHPSAVPAIVEVLCMSNRTLAEYGVKTLGQIPEYQASRALAGQGVFSPWKPVRIKAADLLKQRKLEQFAPDLLLLLSNPIRTKVNVGVQVSAAKTKTIAADADVKFNLDYVWVEETADTVRVGIRRLFPVSSSGNFTQVVSERRPWIAGLYDANGQRTTLADSMQMQNLALAEIAEQKEMLDYAAESMNGPRVAINERVGTVLSHCTDEPMSAEPKVWQDWWTTFSSVAPSGPKNVVVVDERTAQPNAPSFSRTTVQRSCLVAGTPVWTDRGLVAIEQILPGDRVLAKEISSGELGYKPVLQTTVREPTPVQTFKVGDDAIMSSLGHHFWVSGDGWTKLRELLPQQPLHTATGMQRITSIEDEGRIEKVYNLVIADFHTYFVGKTMVLSHDVTMPNLTNVKVPGLIPK